MLQGLGVGPCSAGDARKPRGRKNLRLPMGVFYAFHDQRSVMANPGIFELSLVPSRTFFPVDNVEDDVGEVETEPASSHNMLYIICSTSCMNIV